MSPESCQGFRHGYAEFKSLVDEYKRQCEEKIAKARQTCVNSRPELGEFDADLEGVIATRAGLKSLPVLEHYIPAMDRLNARLDDCLRDTPGEIAVTNKDRGDAATGGVVHASASGFGAAGGGALIGRSQENPPVGQRAVKQSQSPRSGSAEASNICLDPALAGSSMCAPGGEFVVTAESKDKHGTHGSAVRQGAQLRRDSDTETAGSSTPDFRMPGLRPGDRAPSSVSGPRSRGIANRHSDLFWNIRKRYSHVKPTLLTD